MNIHGSTVLVTGADGGLGSAFVKALREAGCAKIFAAARRTFDAELQKPQDVYARRRAVVA